MNGQPATVCLPTEVAPAGKPASLLQLLRATVWLGLAFTRAAWYFKTRALNALALPHAEALKSKEKRRLQHYFYGTTYLSVVFCMVRNRIRTRRPL